LPLGCKNENRMLCSSSYWWVQLTTCIVYEWQAAWWQWLNHLLDWFGVVYVKLQFRLDSCIQSLPSIWFLCIVIQSWLEVIPVWGSDGCKDIASPLLMIICIVFGYDNNSKAYNDGCPKKCILASYSLKLISFFHICFVSRVFSSFNVSAGTLFESNKLGHGSQIEWINSETLKKNIT
jgi:hypothetical protein